MINKYRRTINREFEKTSFWPTFTDLLCTVLMVVILILFSSESLVESLEQDLSKNIYDSVNEVFKDSEIPVEVDKTSGKIVFGENSLFDVDSDELKPEAKEILNVFIPKYVETIYKNYEEHISRIVITGHTDDVGDYLYNLDLSQRRALSVAKYIVGEEIGDYKYKEDVKQYIEAIGRSEAELIKDNNGNVDREASRRVEINYEINLN